MMVVVMVMTGRVDVFHMATPGVAMLISRLQFQCHVADTIGFQLFPHGLFNSMGICIRHNMHRPIAGLPIHAPKMDMVHIQNTGNLHKLLLDLLHI